MSLRGSSQQSCSYKRKVLCKSTVKYLRHSPKCLEVKSDSKFQVEPSAVSWFVSVEAFPKHALTLSLYPKLHYSTFFFHGSLSLSRCEAVYRRD